jgi:site-specific DNA recombinase
MPQSSDVLARQRVVRLIVKEIVVDNDSIAIRHSIPNSPRNSGGPTNPSFDAFYEPSP